jgi:hypothetical protein
MFTDYKNNDYTNLSDTLDAIYTQVAADKLNYNLYVNIKQGTVVPSGILMPADVMTNTQIANALSSGNEATIFNYHNKITGETKRIAGATQLQATLDSAANDNITWLNATVIVDYLGYIYHFTSVLLEDKAASETEVANAIKDKRTELLAESDHGMAELLESVVFGSLSESDSDVVEWYDYRENLRDLENQSDFPQSYVWPAEPSGI